MRRMRFFTAVLVLLISSASIGHSAEIGCMFLIVEEGLMKKLIPGDQPTEGICATGYLRGEIAKGDYETFRNFYRKNWPSLLEVYLISPGGDAYEAIKIGKLLRKYLIGVSVSTYINGYCEGSHCVCASACTLIWFGGIERTGTVGLHRPQFDDSTFANRPPEEATKLYKRALDDIAHYLDEMEAPRPMIDAMVATSSSEIRWVDAKTDQLERPPSYAEWEDAACRTKPTSATPWGNECRVSLRLSHIKNLPPP